MTTLRMENTLLVVIILTLAMDTSRASGSIRYFYYEKLQQTNVYLYCKYVSSRNSMLECITKGWSGWIVGYNQEQCLVCYFDDTEPEFKLFNGSKGSFLWITQTSTLQETTESFYTLMENLPEVFVVCFYFH